MFYRRIGRLALSLTLLAALGFSTVVRAETTVPIQTPAAPQDYSGAQFVYLQLGTPELQNEQGIRLVDGQPDGLTEADPRGGRRSLANAVGPDRYMYFDVHDTYIKDGFNKVIMTVTYEDVGLTPIDVEYDAYDVVNPANKADEWIKKRVTVALRTNSGGVKTARIVLEDARFGGNQPGGADLRLVTTEDLVVRNISVMRSWDPTSSLPIRVLVDSKEVLFDVLPFVNPETSLTLVPMRKLFNALGVSDNEIIWDGATRTVTAKKGETIIVLRIDSDQALVQGQLVKLAQPAVIKDGRTLIPLRFVSETLGLNVTWNGAQRLITITATPSTPTP